MAGAGFSDAPHTGDKILPQLEARESESGAEECDGFPLWPHLIYAFL